jgi:hypothetical protein
MQASDAIFLGRITRLVSFEAIKLSVAIIKHARIYRDFYGNSC